MIKGVPGEEAGKADKITNHIFLTRVHTKSGVRNRRTQRHSCKN